MDQLKKDSSPEKFAIRISTMLLAYVALLYIAGRLLSRPALAHPLLEQVLGGLANTVPVILLLAAIFAISTFIESLIKRSPKAQPLVEGVVSVLLFCMIPVY